MGFNSGFKGLIIITDYDVFYYYYYYYNHCNYYYYWDYGEISQFSGRTTLTTDFLSTAVTPSSANIYWELFPGAPSSVTRSLPLFSILLHYVVLS